MMCRKVKLIIAALIVCVGAFSPGCQQAEPEEAPMSFEGFSPAPDLGLKTFQGENIEYVVRYTAENGGGHYDTLLLDSMGNHIKTIIPEGDTVLKAKYNALGFATNRYRDDYYVAYRYKRQGNTLIGLYYSASEENKIDYTDPRALATYAYNYEDGRLQTKYTYHDSSAITRYYWGKDKLMRTVYSSSYNDVEISNYHYLKNDDLLVVKKRVSYNRWAGSYSIFYDSAYYYYTNGLIDSAFIRPGVKYYYNYKLFDKRS